MAQTHAEARLGGTGQGPVPDPAEPAVGMAQGVQEMEPRVVLRVRATPPPVRGGGAAAARFGQIRNARGRKWVICYGCL